MDITGIAKSHQAGIQKSRKPSSNKEWKLSDSLREKITEYAKEDATQNVYMSNKFLTLRKSEVAKVAPNRSALMGKLNQNMAILHVENICSFVKCICKFTMYIKIYSCKSH